MFDVPLAFSVLLGGLHSMVPGIWVAIWWWRCWWCLLGWSLCLKLLGWMECSTNAYPPYPVLTFCTRVVTSKVRDKWDVTYVTTGRSWAFAFRLRLVFCDSVRRLIQAAVIGKFNITPGHHRCVLSPHVRVYFGCWAKWAPEFVPGASPIRPSFAELES